MHRWHKSKIVAHAMFSTGNLDIHCTEQMTRYAAEGDADVDAGASASKQKESDKLQALEREVLEYPG